MDSNTIIFFRNDDVRGTLDKSLIDITDIFIRYNIPITHAVEPGNLKPDVIDWLIKTKIKYPKLIEIMQHGLDHTNKNKIRKGEFGGQRGYQEQFADIKKGKELMDKYFGDLWFPAFCFPNGPYNIEAMKALVDNDFKVVNGGWEIDIKHKLFYMISHIFRKELLFGKRVPYNLQHRPKNKIFQINVNISFIKKYLNGKTDSIMHTLDELITETLRFRKEKTIGFLLHHRYHDDENNIQLVEKYLAWLKQQTNFEFTTIENIYQRYAFRE